MNHCPDILFPSKNEVAWQGDMWHVANDGDGSSCSRSVASVPTETEQKSVTGGFPFFCTPPSFSQSDRIADVKGKEEGQTKEYEIMHVITPKVYQFGQ